MKQFSAIFLAVIVLLINVGLTASNHYCGGKLAKSMIAIGHANVGCGMESDDISTCELASDKNTLSKEECCKDEYTLISVEDDFNNTSIQEAVLDYTFVTAFASIYTNLYSLDTDRMQDFLAYTPPLLNPDTQVMFQSFLI